MYWALRMVGLRLATRIFYQYLVNMLHWVGFTILPLPLDRVCVCVGTPKTRKRKPINICMNKTIFIKFSRIF